VRYILLGFILLRVVEAQALADSQIYIHRELGVGGSQGSSGIELVCVEPKSKSRFCRISKTHNDSTQQFKDLTPFAADRLFQEFVSSLGPVQPRRDPAYSGGGGLIWSVFYKGKLRSGRISHLSSVPERDQLALMRLEAKLFGALR